MAIAMPLCRRPLAPDQSIAAKRVNSGPFAATRDPLHLARPVPPGPLDHHLDPFARWTAIADEHRRPAAIVRRLPERVRLGLHQHLFLVEWRRHREAAFLAPRIDESLAAKLDCGPAVGGG